MHSLPIQSIGKNVNLHKNLPQFVELQNILFLKVLNLKIISDIINITFSIFIVKIYIKKAIQTLKFRRKTDEKRQNGSSLIAVGAFGSYFMSYRYNGGYLCVDEGYTIQ